MKAARDKKYDDDSGKYVDKYLQNFCLHWWNAFTNHAGCSCDCRRVFQGLIHSIAKGFASLCHYAMVKKCVLSITAQSFTWSVSVACCVEKGTACFEHLIGHPWYITATCYALVKTIISLSLLYTKLEEDQLSGTERDNCLLLEKMSCIMRTKGEICNKNYYKAKK